MNKTKKSETPSKYHFWAVFSVWLLIAIIPWVRVWQKGKQDVIYAIFSHSFWHAWEHKPLYIYYPEDKEFFLYGPLFSLLMAPFAVLPFQLGRLCWMLLITFIPYWSIRHSFFTLKQQLFILWFVALEAHNCIFYSESNTLVMAGVLFTYFLTEKEKDCWAAFLIALGTVTKIYGIVGLAFFPFSKHKLKFLGWFVVWMVVLSVLPMVVFGFDYVCQEYVRWYHALEIKNMQNMFAPGQNISLLGMVRKISGAHRYSDLWILVPGVIAYALPYLRFSQYKHEAFRMMIMASTLMFVVLFSTGSESCGYIIAMVGVAIWFTASPWKRGRWDIALLVFAFIFTSLVVTDVCPKYIWHGLLRPYALKALPVILIWFRLMYELYVKDYDPKKYIA